MAASVKLMYQPQPTPEVVKAFKDTSIKAFSCGYNHVVALDTEKQAWSWGESLSALPDKVLPRLRSLDNAQTPIFITLSCPIGHLILCDTVPGLLYT